MKLDKVILRYKKKFENIKLIGEPGEIRRQRRYLFGLIKWIEKYKEYTYEFLDDIIDIYELEKQLNNANQNDDYVMMLLELNYKNKQVYYKPMIRYINDDGTSCIKTFVDDYDLKNYLRQNESSFENLSDFSILSM